MDGVVVAIIQCLCGPLFIDEPIPMPMHQYKSVVFSSTIESMYKAHGLNVIAVARDYEKKQNKKTDLTTLYRVMYSSNLRMLLPIVHEQVQHCLHEQDVLAVQMAIMEQHVEQKKLIWTVFIDNVYKQRFRQLQNHIPNLWIPTEQQRADYDTFFKRNAPITLTLEQKQILTADVVLNYIPFALMECCDKESFKHFLS